MVQMVEYIIEANRISGMPDMVGGYRVDENRFAGMMDRLEDYNIDRDLYDTVWDMVWRLHDDIEPIVERINRNPQLVDTYRAHIRHHISLFRDNLEALYDSDQYYHDEIELVEELADLYLDNGVIFVPRW